MKTLYKSSRFIAATIVGALLLSAGGAVALTRDAQRETQPVMPAQYQDMGRFVVTPKAMTYAMRTTEDMGRFVVTRHSAIYLPAA